MKKKYRGLLSIVFFCWSIAALVGFYCLDATWPANKVPTQDDADFALAYLSIVAAGFFVSFITAVSGLFCSESRRHAIMTLSFFLVFFFLAFIVIYIGGNY